MLPQAKFIIHIFLCEAFVRVLIMVTEGCVISVPPSAL